MCRTFEINDNARYLVLVKWSLKLRRIDAIVPKSRWEHCLFSFITYTMKNRMANAVNHIASFITWKKKS